MAKVKEKNCRLCLKMLDNEYVLIEDGIRETFTILILKVDLSVSEEPVLCKSCMKSAQEAYNFTSTFISIDEQVLSLATRRNSAILDIRDVYLEKNENKGLTFNEEYSVCRFCLECLEKSSFIPLNDLRNDSTGEMLLTCIPELDLNIIKEPVVCTSCIKSLESYYSFAMQCRDTEENVMKYREVQGAECNGHISLSNVLKFLGKGAPECTDKCSKIAVPKIEDNLFHNEGETYSDTNNIVFKIEEEEVVIKDENIFGDCKTNEGTKGVDKCDEVVHKYSSNVVMYEYKCERCTYEAKYKDDLDKHMVIHKENPDMIWYKCNSCSYKSIRKSNFMRHMLTHQDSAVVMYTCEKCTFKSKYKSSLENHMIIHKVKSELTMYKCKLCSHQSKSKIYLRRHMLTHKDSSEVVMYNCERCAFKSRYKNCLKRHMLIHVGRWV